MIDQKTPALQLPLPHPDNELEDDVVRLRAALTTIDSTVGGLRTLLASDDLNLDTLQEVVNVLKSAQGDISNITQLLATKGNAADLSDCMTRLTTIEVGLLIGLYDN